MSERRAGGGYRGGMPASEVPPPPPVPSAAMAAAPAFPSGELRSLLRESVTVVKPGELLVIRVSENFTPNQWREYQQVVNRWLAENAPDIKALVVPAAGGQIVRQVPEDEAALTERINRILARQALRNTARRA